MNRLPPNGSMSRPLYTPIQFKDFEVSWAGPNPLGPGFAFGSEDGRVLMTDETGVPLPKKVQESITGEAINGIAGSGMSFAVSSRSEVTLVTWTAKDPDRKAVSGIPVGAHGITVAPSGHYVAPLGRTGIMILSPTSTGPNDPIGVITPQKEGLYFYRVIALPSRGGKDLLVCAARQGGMGIREFQPGQPDTIRMKVLTFAGLDLVDVCAVGSTPDVPAVAGVGRDGTLLLVRDALQDQNPVTIKFESIQGTAYRLLSARGHLFLLTSRGLYGLMNLGERLLHGRAMDQLTTSIFTVPMEAVDANIVGDRWLLVTMPDEVLKFDVDLIDRSTPEDSRNGEIREVIAEKLTPDWQVQSVQQRSSQLAGAM
jgi:hypothetical protein